MRNAGEKLRFPPGKTCHRRGPFNAGAIGFSYGGGRKVCFRHPRFSTWLIVPVQTAGNFVHSDINMAIYLTLIATIAIQRFAGFASSMSNRL
jgi:hypothetical protein